MALAPPATTGITSAMTTALSTAQTALNTLVGSGNTISDLSLTKLQTAIQDFEVAYNVYLAGLTPPAGINLDSITGPSTLDGFNGFAKEAGLVAAESDVQTALFYLGRIISNLMLATG